MGINISSLTAFSFLAEAEFDRTRGFIGLGIVCAVLIVAWCIYAIVSHRQSDAPRKSAPALTEVLTRPETSGMSEEVIAAISAAIFMAESESDGELKFRVVSFRRK
ncbi:MAG: OadG family protein [Clostridia bacterium]|nr:OadG family protein [Clostridia bacterium]